MYIVGDAAGQVKATTGGGIVPGMGAAESLAQSIIEGKDYEKLWRKNIGFKIWIHLFMRNTMDKFKESDYETLLQQMNKEKIKREISSD